MRVDLRTAFREMYDDVAQEQVPDDFMDLLRQIDEADEKGGKKIS